MTAATCYRIDTPSAKKSTADKWSGVIGAGACIAFASGLSGCVNVQTPNVTSSVFLKQLKHSEQSTSFGGLRLSFELYDSIIDEKQNLLSAKQIVELGSSFGFSKIKWAEVLKVSRETVQKWSANAAANPHQTNVERAIVLNELKNYMVPEHVPYLAKLTQGFLEIEELSLALTNKEVSQSELCSLYDKYYSKFDGAYKRSLLG